MKQEKAGMKREKERLMWHIIAQEAPTIFEIVLEKRKTGLKIGQIGE